MPRRKAMTKKQTDLLERLGGYIGPHFVEISREVPPEHALGIILVQFLQAAELHPEWHHAVVKLYRDVGVSQLVSAEALVEMLPVPA